MAIFARLVLMVFSVLVCAGAGLAMGNISGVQGAPTENAHNVYILVGGLFGGFAGVHVGQWLGNLVVGKPPKV
jgi:hypothetical protein